MMIERSSDQQLVGAIIDLLKELFVEDERFLITSQSMHRLLSLYEEDLLDAIGDSNGYELLASWKGDVAEFREAWIHSKVAERLSLRGVVHPVATESSTEDARAKCAERKRSGELPTSRRRRR
jgi:hypothetical protein